MLEPVRALILGATPLVHLDLTVQPLGGDAAVRQPRRELCGAVLAHGALPGGHRVGRAHVIPQQVPVPEVLLYARHSRHLAPDEDARGARFLRWHLQPQRFEGWDVALGQVLDGGAETQRRLALVHTNRGSDPALLFHNLMRRESVQATGRWCAR